MHSFFTVDFKDNQVVMINQLKLPLEETYEHYKTYQEVARSIKDMVVRGAPAIGITAAYGIALAFINKQVDDNIKDYFNNVANEFAQTRPTAVNLFWAIDRMRSCFESSINLSQDKMAEVLLNEAKAIHKEDIEMCKAIGENGASLLPDECTVLTHCNAGALATGGWGTALGVIRSANLKKKIKVYACETRPYLQGARLTAWELQKDGIDTTVITDNMAGYFLSQGLIDAVIVGSDRVAANGDAANKIGTLNHAVVCKHFKIPIYFALPSSTIDSKTKHGVDIPIEERHATEVTHIKGQQITPKGIKIKNPAFDVTPNELITAIITEKKVYYPPYSF